MTNDIKYERRLGTDRMAPLVFRMALPAVVAQLVNLLYNLVDRIYIGHIPGIGTDALAGVGVTGSVIILVSAFASIVSGGAAPLASIALGRGNRDAAGRYLGNGVTMIVFFSILCSVPVYIFMEPILVSVGASERTLAYAADYLSVYLSGTLFVLVSLGLNTFIYTQGRPGIAMTSVIIGSIMNIALDPLFIFSFGMGVKGAALATVISQACSAVWIMAFLLSRKRATLCIELKAMRPDWKIIGAILALGVSPFIMASTESIVGFVLNSSLMHYGDVYVSALAVMQSAMMLVSVPLAGFAQGFIPVASYNYGMGNADRVKSCLRVVVTAMFTFNITVVLFMILFPSVVASVFTDDPRLVSVVSEEMPLFLAGMTIFGLQRAFQNMFVALNQARLSIFIALLRKIILLVPLALILPRFMGLDGVFAAEAVSDATAAICCTAIFLVMFPKILEKNCKKMGK